MLGMLDFQRTSNQDLVIGVSKRTSRYRHHQPHPIVQCNEAQSGIAAGARVVSTSDAGPSWPMPETKGPRTLNVATRTASWKSNFP